LRQPCFNLCFAHDRQDFHRCLVEDVIEYPNLTDTKPILRMLKSAKPLDTAAADFAGSYRRWVSIAALTTERVFAGRRRKSSMASCVRKILNGIPERYRRARNFIASHCVLQRRCRLRYRPHGEILC
jgi:hypothetical protein